MVASLETKRAFIESISSQVKFVDGMHRYWIGETPAPSVSRLDRPITDEELKDIPEWRLNAAADRGKSVHSTIQLYENTGMEMWGEDLAGYMAGYLAWKAYYPKIHVLAVEKPIYHRLYRYAGTPDIFTTVEDENFITLIDNKCVETLSLGNLVQAYSYSNAMASHEAPEGITIAPPWLLQLFPDGTFWFNCIYDLIDGVSAEAAEQIIKREHAGMVHHYSFMQYKIKKRR